MRSSFCFCLVNPPWLVVPLYLVYQQPFGCHVEDGHASPNFTVERGGLRSTGLSGRWHSVVAMIVALYRCLKRMNRLPNSMGSTSSGMFTRQTSSSTRLLMSPTNTLLAPGFLAACVSSISDMGETHSICICSASRLVT